MTMDEAQQQQHDNHREGERTPDRSGHRKEQSCDLANQGSDHQDNQALVPTGQEGEGTFGGASSNLGVYLTGQGDAFFGQGTSEPQGHHQFHQHQPDLGQGSSDSYFKRESSDYGPMLNQQPQHVPLSDSYDR